MRCLALMLVLLLASATFTRAQDAPATQPAALRATLPDGTTVELLGVAEIAVEAKTWWRPDGTPLEQPPYPNIPNRMPAGAGQRSIELPLRMTGPDGKPKRRLTDGFDFRWSSTDAALGLTGRAENGRTVPGDSILLGAFPQALDRTTLKLRFMTQDRQVRATLPARESAPGEAPAAVRADVPLLGVVELSAAREIVGQAEIDVKIPKPPEGLQVVVVAKPQPGQGFIAPVTPRDTLGGTNGEWRTIRFTVPLDQIREFTIETRDYADWVEFRDISLRPGTVTRPAIVTGREPRPAE